MLLFSSLFSSRIETITPRLLIYFSIHPSIPSVHPISPSDKEQPLPHSFKNEEEIKAATQDCSAYVRIICEDTAREDTAPSEEMTRKALRGAVRHFPRVLKSITSTANLGANLGEIAEQEWLVPIDLETKKDKSNPKRRNGDDHETS